MCFGDKIFVLNIDLYLLLAIISYEGGHNYLHHLGHSNPVDYMDLYESGKNHQWSVFVTL